MRSNRISAGRRAGASFRHLPALAALLFSLSTFSVASAQSYSPAGAKAAPAPAAPTGYADVVSRNSAASAPASSSPQTATS